MAESAWANDDLHLHCPAESTFLPFLLAFGHNTENNIIGKSVIAQK
jgi:hypothetical protein